MKEKWKCPQCGAPANKHGKGGSKTCETNPGEAGCNGMICECPSGGANNLSEKRDHGISFSNPCPNAECFHCRWSGTFPVIPKGLEAWEKKALAAGWTMPEKRAKELKKI